jgi:carbon-monoxide dehydrogenase large subunit
MMGTGGSRAATMASGSVSKAALAVRRQLLELAACLLEANADDLDLAEGVVSVRGVPEAAIPLAQIAGAVYFVPGMFPPGTPGSIEAYGEFRSGAGGWVQATHLCCVEIDAGTGKVEITRYIVAEDCGVLINPAIVEGQIRGGVAQAIGSVLYERSAYDSDGQYLAATFMDYLLPTAAEVPPIEIHHVETQATNHLDARGSGEGGAIVGPPAITNAIEDALAHLGVKVTEHHLPPQRILELLGQIPHGTVNGV